MPVALPNGSPRSRIAQWLAHRATWLLISAFVVSVGVDLIAQGNSISWNILPALIVLVVQAAQHNHGLVICPRCAHDMPLDPDAEAAKRKSTLAWAHRMYGRLYGRLTDIALVVFIALSWGLWVSGAAPVVASIGFDWLCLVTAVETYVLAVHRSLRPWCPQCHWDGEGDHEQAPSPTPSPVGGVVT
jgi:hypothetical protein